MNRFFLSLFVAFPLFLCGTEFLKNNDWRTAGPSGAPSGPWRYDDRGSYRFTPASGDAPGVVAVTPGGKRRDACLVCDAPVKFPQGSELTVSGEYRTVDYVPGKNGTIFANLGYNYGRSDRAWQCVFLKPTAGEWRKFSGKKRIPVEAKGPFRAYFYVKGDSGTVQWRRLSLKMNTGVSVVRRDRVYVWREAEDIFRNFPPVKEKTASGRGAVYASGNKPLVWKFRISPVTDKKTLFEKEFTYHIWIRTYGYIKDPVIKTRLNGRPLSEVKTIGNEKTDAKGDYAGPGSYYWQYIGKFTSRGGGYSLAFSAPRICMDSLLVTDDENFRPQAFEARNAVSDRFSDVHCTNEIYAEFSGVGVCADISSPVSFRITKPAKMIPKGGKPAKFHFSVPDFIEVCGAASHRATTKWGQPNTWLGRPLAWRKTGKSTFNGIAMTDYEMDIYYLCGNQYWWFLRVRPDAFVENRRVPAIFHLENGKEKQSPETMHLVMTKVPAARPFKKIYICGEGGEFSGFWNGWDGLFASTRHAGLNAMGLWGFERGIPEAQKAFADRAKKENIRIFGALSPFWPPMKLEPDERAVGQDGKYHRRGALFVPTLSQNENSKAMTYMRDYLRKSAAAGSRGMILDDEWSNQIFDKVDYHPATKELFRKYLESRGEKYTDPVEIVKNRRKYAKLHGLWVDFRCERMAEFYRAMKAAYVSGLADKCDPFFCTGIQGRGATPQEIKASNFFDYRLLAEYCDHIIIMCYTYAYIRQSAEVGDTLETYDTYIGRKVCAPALLCDYEGHEIPEDQKAVQKYQLWEALMQQARFVGYWMSYGMYNPRNLRHIAEGIRQLSDYEDILLDGRPEKSVGSAEKFLRIKTLRLGKRLLIYAANYQHPAHLKARIDVGVPVRSVTALADGGTVALDGGTFVFDSSVERGQLFLAELK
ncbi:MAG: hypothetical protein IJU70_08415 [Lentisphaeria bacterium]|nr:hypothetical protein [Lentisphaeria bacterium]